MRLVIRLFLVILFLVAIFGGIFFFKYQQGQQMAAMQSAPQPPASVSATEARGEQWQSAIESVGTLEAVNGIAVTTEVAGTISEIGFESGQEVNAGDILVRFEETIDRAALNGLIADSELARTQYERATELSSRRAISQSEIDESRFRYEGVQARVEEQQARLAKKTIRAPFSGLLGLRLVNLGEYVTPGREIVQLRTLDPIYVDYSIPEREYRDPKVGQKVEVVVPAYPDLSFHGTVSAIDSGVDEGTRSVRIRATLSNPDRLLRPGMFAEVRTLRPEMREVVTVPRTAISFNTYGDFVFVINEDEEGKLTVTRNQVKTGDSSAGRISITEGLQVGDRVVRAGLVKLRDGQSIAIDNSVELDDADISQQ